MKAMTMTQTHGMTAAAEVWRVAQDGGSLSLSQGVYGSAEAMRIASDGLTLASGQGLAGAVLARRVPILLHELDAESFERCEAARDSGIASAVSLPVFDEAKLTYVVSFMFRGGEPRVGGVELWTGRRGRFELGMTAAFYSGLERFGAISKHVNFPRGSGLPGLVWESACPKIMTGLGSSRAFLRSSGAESAGLRTGMGLPVIHRNELQAVMLWLSSHNSPLAVAHEVWESADGRPESLACSYATRGDNAMPTSDNTQMPVLILESAQQRRPILFEDGSMLGTRWNNVSMEGGVALPVLVHDRVRAVLMMAW
jgi:hypothetical protein